MDLNYLRNKTYTEKLSYACESCGNRPDFRTVSPPFQVYEDKTEWGIWKSYLYDKLNYWYNNKNGFDTYKILASYNLNELKRFYLLCPMCFYKFINTPFVSSPTIERTIRIQEQISEVEAEYE